MAPKKKDEQVESLKPSPPPSLAPRGIRAFTVYRSNQVHHHLWPLAVLEPSQFIVMMIKQEFQAQAL